jgi:hypothetical protein
MAARRRTRASNAGVQIMVTDKYEKDLERWEKLLKEISRKGG